jgi:hypothetical protein
VLFVLAARHAPLATKKNAWREALFLPQMKPSIHDLERLVNPILQTCHNREQIVQ